MKISCRRGAIPTLLGVVVGRDNRSVTPGAGSFVDVKTARPCAATSACLRSCIRQGQRMLLRFAPLSLVAVLITMPPVVLQGVMYLLPSVTS